MSLNLGGSEIIKVSQIGKKIEIQAEAEKKAFDISTIVDVELQLIESDNNVDAFVGIGTLVGLVAGDFTGAVSGGFSGWLASKLFSKEDTFLLSIVLLTMRNLHYLLEPTKKIFTFLKFNLYITNLYLKK